MRKSVTPATLLVQGCLLLSSLFTCSILLAQAPAIEWQRCLGGSADDAVLAMHPTKDGGYILGGVTASKDGDVVGNHGGADIWVVKLNANGTTAWQKALGGGKEEQGTIIHQTADGGYIVGGITASANGDVKGFRGGTGDIWVVKLSATGALQWQKPIGGAALDKISSVLELPNNAGYIVGGTTASSNGDVVGFHGGEDYIVSRLAADGRVLWTKVYGGSGTEKLHQIQPAADGGFVLAGATWSNATNDGDVLGFHGGSDVWVLKINDKGDKQWQYSFGGTGLENWLTLQQSGDGGYVMACEGGASNTGPGNNGDLATSLGGTDILVVKIKGDGTIGWKKVLGGSKGESLRSMKRTTDGGYLIGGSTGSLDGDAAGNTATGAWIVKLTPAGAVQWQYVVNAGTIQEEMVMTDETADGGCIAHVTVNMKQYASNLDLNVYLVKLDKYGKLQWTKNNGGSLEEWYGCGSYINTLVRQVAYLYSTVLHNFEIQESANNYFFGTNTLSKELPGFHTSRLGLRYDIWVVKLKPTATYNTPVPVTEMLDVKHSAFPNPFTGRSTIFFQATVDGPALVELYDVKGTRIATVFSGTVKKGSTYSLPVGDASLPKGVYTYRVTNGSSRITGKLVKSGR